MSTSAFKAICIFAGILFLGLGIGEWNTMAGLIITGMLFLIMAMVQGVKN